MTARRLGTAALLLGLAAAASGCAPSPRAVAAAEAELHADTAIAAAVGAATRTEANRARDQYRHPRETLAFFGVKPSDTVVEIWPGGGWYSEILAPYLARGGGTYYAASLGANGHNGVRRLMEADRKSTRLNSSHANISYAVFCLKKKKQDK